MQHLKERRNLVLEEPQLINYFEKQESPNTQDIAAILSLKTNLPVIAVPYSEQNNIEEQKLMLPFDQTAQDVEFQEKVFESLQSLNEMIEKTEKRVLESQVQRNSVLELLEKEKMKGFQVGGNIEGCYQDFLEKYKDLQRMIVQLQRLRDEVLEIKYEGREQIAAEREETTKKLVEFERVIKEYQFQEKQWEADRRKMDELEDKLRLSIDRLKVIEAENANYRAKDALLDSQIKSKDSLQNRMFKNRPQIDPDFYVQQIQQLQAINAEQEEKLKVLSRDKRSLAQSLQTMTSANKHQERRALEFTDNIKQQLEKMKDILTSENGALRGGELFSLINIIGGYCDAHELLFNN